MTTNFNQQITRPGVRQALRILMLCALIIFAGLTQAAQTFAQGSCQDLNALTSFNYRSRGIGVHRNCDWYDPVCNALRLKQIALGAPVASSNRRAAVGGAQRSAGD